MNKAFKLLLYAKTYFSYIKFTKTPENTDDHIFAHGEFCGLYGLIVSGDLEDDYLEWRENIADRDAKMNELRDEIARLERQLDEAKKAAGIVDPQPFE